MTPAEIREFWTERAMRGMPPELEVSERCRAIAAKYGRYYQEHPLIYLWAGVAAFAVHQIGLALLLYDFEVFEGAVTNVAEDYQDPRGPELLFNDLNHLRQANNSFFKDVAWTFEAYMAPDGGFAVVEQGLSDLPDHETLREAFRKIDAGRQLLDSPATRKKGVDLIWAGSLLVEYHGQVFSAQKFYDSADPGFDLFLTTFTVMNYQVFSFGIDLWKFTSFDLFMWTLGIPKLIMTMSLPNLARLDHRWYWITKRVFPLWRKVTLKDNTLKRNIAAIVRAGELTRLRTATPTAQQVEQIQQAAAAGSS